MFLVLQSRLFIFPPNTLICQGQLHQINADLGRTPFDWMEHPDINSVYLNEWFFLPYSKISPQFSKQSHPVIPSCSLKRRSIKDSYEVDILRKNVLIDRLSYLVHLLSQHLEPPVFVLCGFFCFFLKKFSSTCRFHHHTASVLLFYCLDQSPQRQEEEAECQLCVGAKHRQVNPSSKNKPHHRCLLCDKWLFICFNVKESD